MIGAHSTEGTEAWSAEMHSLLADARRSALLKVSAGLFVFGVGVGTSGGGDFDRRIYCALAILFATLLVWVAQRTHPSLAGWLLVGGWLGSCLLMLFWAEVTAAVWLLPIAAGIGSLLISTRVGLALATVLTIALVAAPESWPVTQDARFFVAFTIWGVVGLIWQAMRPMQTVGGWAWSAYERSQELVETSRNQQQLLQQTLEDLTASNHQLVRLNRLTESLRLEAESARQAKEQFVANVSHELRTPLNMIIGFSEMITSTPEIYGARIPSSLLADLSVVLRNSQHLASLIDDVLDLSQIEAGQTVLAREMVSMAELVSSAAAAVRPLYESKRLYLRVDMPAELPPTYVDRTRIRQVLLNLLSNAGRFTDTGGVTVVVRSSGTEMQVHVTDTGPGIAADDQDRLFQPFQQADGTIRRRYGGSGLGLSISRRFVELHGGRMGLESTPGEGSTFSFSIPIRAPHLPDGSATQWLVPGWEFFERTHRSLASPPPHRARWVICDESGSLARTIARHAPGVEVVAFSSLTEAIADVALVPAQALIVNGIEGNAANVSATISSALHGAAPVILCSVPGVSNAARGLGAEEYLVKPISRDALLLSLERLALQGKTILIADDDVDALRLFWRILASVREGYRVLTASDGKAAWEIMVREHPDAVVVDLSMPEMDGLQFLAAKNADPVLRAIPTIIVSARDPFGHPIVSHSLTVLRGDGLSLLQVLACVRAVSGILAPGRVSHDPGLPATPSG